MLKGSQVEKIKITLLTTFSGDRFQSNCDLFVQHMEGISSKHMRKYSECWLLGPTPGSVVLFPAW